MELLTKVLGLTSSNVALARVKLASHSVLLKYNYFFDELFYKAYQYFGEREESIYIPDKVIFISLKEHRMVLMNFFFNMVCVSSGQRKSVVSNLNSRMVDIIMIWVREKFDTSFVMVSFR
jgi:hypothetical protein